MRIAVEHDDGTVTVIDHPTASGEPAKGTSLPAINAGASVANSGSGGSTSSISPQGDAISAGPAPRSPAGA